MQVRESFGILTLGKTSCGRRRECSGIGLHGYAPGICARTTSAHGRVGLDD